LFQQILLDAPHDHVKTVGVGGTVTVSEEVSGDNSPCHPKNGLVADCVKQVTNTNETCVSAAGLPNQFGCAVTLSFVPGEPTIWASDNYLRELSLTAMRKPYIHSCPPTAGCDSKEVMTRMGVVKITKFVPVLGTREISGDVKKSYTVSTGATLVFNTIHDPPGGLSSATWAESSTSTHTITINGVKAKQSSAGSRQQHSGGADMSMSISLAPFGFGVHTTALAINTKGFTAQGTKPRQSDSAQATDTSGWEVTMTATKDISTSSNPATAGRASDIIIGGGLELLFEESVVVDQKPDEEDLCIIAAKEVQWEPAKLTTFVYSVMEIRDQMRRIELQRDFLKDAAKAEGVAEDEASEMDQQATYLTNKYNEWKTVLTKYDASSSRANLLAEREHMHKRMSQVIASASSDQRNEQTEQQATEDWSMKFAGLGYKNYDAFKYFTSGAEKKGTGVTQADTAKIRKAMNHMKSQYDELQNMCMQHVSGGSRFSKHPELSWDLKSECGNMDAHPARLFQRLQGMKIQIAEEGVPGTDRIDHKQGPFDAVEGREEGQSPSYITFSGGGEVLTFSHDISSRADFNLNVGVGKGFSSNRESGATVGGAVGVLGYEYSTSFSASTQASDDESAGQAGGRTYAAQVIWTVGDPDPRDKFIVQIMNNVAYGVPVFHTLAGASRCPAEPNTTPREAGVQILKIEPRCSPQSLPTSPERECKDLQPGVMASFAIKLRTNYLDCMFMNENGCVKQDDDSLFDFVLLLANGFDTKYDAATVHNKYDGSTQGSGGLVIMVDGVVMGKDEILLPMVPLGESEVVMTVAQGPTYSEYENIQLIVVSECEQAMVADLCLMPQSSMDGNEDAELPTCQPFSARADLATGTFSVSWSSDAPTRRLGDDETQPRRRLDTQNSDFEKLHSVLNRQQSDINQLRHMVAGLLLTIAFAVVATVSTGWLRKIAVADAASVTRRDKPVL
jgi:hypothetical protein